MLANILVMRKAIYVAKDAQNVNLFVLNNLGMRETISLMCEVGHGIIVQ